MHMVVLLLLIIILLYKTICRLSFRVFSVVITWLVKYGRDFKTRKDFFRTNICKRLSCGSFGFQNIIVRTTQRFVQLSSPSLRHKVHENLPSVAYHAADILAVFFSLSQSLRKVVFDSTSQRLRQRCNDFFEHYLV